MTDLVSANINEEGVLKALGIDRDDPASQALLLICQKYDFDPLIRHMVLIPVRFKMANGQWGTKREPYVTVEG